MKILSLVGSKGGVGKSTIAVSLAVEYERRGHRVLLVDLDPQHSVLRWARKRGPQGGLKAIAAGGDFGDVIHGMAGFDVAIIDTPGRDSEILRRAILASHLAIFPVSPSSFDVWAMQGAIAHGLRATAIAPHLQLRGMVSCAKPRRSFTREVSNFFEACQVEEFKAHTSDLVEYVKAISGGEGPTTMFPDSKAAAQVRALADEAAEILNLKTRSLQNAS